jgi:hypothetical protein
MSIACDGNDWIDFFDLVIADVKRPLFYKTNKPLVTFDKVKITEGEELLGYIKQEQEKGTRVEKKFYFEGNVGLVTDYYKKLCKKDMLRVGYFGSDLIFDVLSAQ